MLCNTELHTMGKARSYPCHLVLQFEIKKSLFEQNTVHRYIPDMPMYMIVGKNVMLNASLEPLSTETHSVSLLNSTAR